jgi:hypothetical protein
MIIQMIVLLTSWKTLKYEERTILIVSVILGLTTASMSLASVDVKSGTSFINMKYLRWLGYYMMDAITKILSYSILFVTIQKYGLILLGLDWFIRLIFCCHRGGVRWSTFESKFALTVKFLGSEGLMMNVINQKKGELIKHRYSYIIITLSHILTVFITIYSLFAINLLRTETVRELRQDNVVLALTILLCVSSFIVYIFFLFAGMDDTDIYESVIRFPFMYLL